MANTTVESGKPKIQHHRKPLLSFWQLWNMSFGYVGIQFGFALQNSNMSRIFQTLHADMGTIPILWIAGPVSGMLVQPIIGHMSDKTWNRLGRRKPYFLVGALLSSLALIVMPNSPALWFAAGMMWVLDSSINVTMQPFRAFIGDMLPDEQRTAGFAMQTFFIGISSVVASSLPYMLSNWLHIKNTAPDLQIPDTVKWSFYAGGIVYLVAVLWTIFTVKEYSPEEQDAFNVNESASAASDGSDIKMDAQSYMNQGLGLLVAGLAFTALVWFLKWYQGLYILSIGIAVYGIFQIIAAQRYTAGKISGMVEIIYDLRNMPKTMTQLALVTILTWFGMFCWFIYCTPAITSFHYGTSDTMSKAYNDGADWVGILNSWYNGVAAVMAPMLPFMARKLGRVGTHVICLIIGGVGLASMYVLKDPHMLLIPMTALGIAWASLLTMPYAILSSAVPHKKMGVYMGMFNLFIVIPQILASASLGLLVQKAFGGQSIYALVLGGVAMAAAGVLTVFVKDKMPDQALAPATGGGGH